MLTMETEVKFNFKEYSEGRYGRGLFLLAEAERSPTNSLLENSFTYQINYTRPFTSKLEHCSQQHNLINHDLFLLEQLGDCFELSWMDACSNQIHFTTNSSQLMEIIEALRTVFV